MTAYGVAIGLTEHYSIGYYIPHGEGIVTESRRRCHVPVPDWRWCHTVRTTTFNCAWHCLRYCLTLRRPSHVPDRQHGWWYSIRWRFPVTDEPITFPLHYGIDDYWPIYSPDTFDLIDLVEGLPYIYSPDSQFVKTGNTVQALLPVKAGQWRNGSWWPRRLIYLPVLCDGRYYWNWLWITMVNTYYCG